MTHRDIALWLLALLVLGTAACDAQQLTTQPAADIVSQSFRQINANCTGVAISKWIIATFDPQTGPFSLKEASDGRTTRLLLADGTPVTLTADQINIAHRHAAFQLKRGATDPALGPAIRHKADTLYAVLGLAMLGQGFDGTRVDKSTFDIRAFRRLDASKVTIDDLLHAMRVSIREDVEDVTMSPIGFIYGNDHPKGGQAHVVFAFGSSPQQYDEHGDTVELTFQQFDRTYPARFFWRYSMLPAESSGVSVGLQCRPEGSAAWVAGSHCPS